jgi:hypothetical protein
MQCYLTIKTFVKYYELSFYGCETWSLILSEEHETEGDSEQGTVEII